MQRKLQNKHALVRSKTELDQLWPDPALKPDTALPLSDGCSESGNGAIEDTHVAELFDRCERLMQAADRTSQRK